MSVTCTCEVRYPVNVMCVIQRGRLWRDRGCFMNVWSGFHRTLMRCTNCSSTVCVVRILRLWLLLATGLIMAGQLTVVLSVFVFQDCVWHRLLLYLINTVIAIIFFYYLSFMLVRNFCLVYKLTIWTSGYVSDFFHRIFRDSYVCVLCSLLDIWLTVQMLRLGYDVLSAICLSVSSTCIVAKLYIVLCCWWYHWMMSSCRL